MMPFSSKIKPVYQLLKQSYRSGWLTQKVRAYFLVFLALSVVISVISAWNGAYAVLIEAGDVVGAPAQNCSSTRSGWFNPTAATGVPAAETDKNIYQKSALWDGGVGSITCNKFNLGNFRRTDTKLVLRLAKTSGLPAAQQVPEIIDKSSEPFGPLDTSGFINVDNAAQKTSVSATSINIEASSGAGKNWRTIATLALPQEQTIFKNYVVTLPPDIQRRIENVQIRLSGRTPENENVQILLDSTYLIYKVAPEFKLTADLADLNGNQITDENTLVYGQNQSVNFQITSQLEESGLRKKTRRLFSEVFSTEKAPSQEVQTVVSYNGIQTVANIESKVEWQDRGIWGSDFWAAEVTPPADFKPGQYNVSFIFTDSNGNTQSTSQDFTWGVLAINPDKSVYRPNEQANFAFAVLDRVGGMVCDAKLTLKINGPSSDTLSTDDGQIRVNEACQQYEVEQPPDYEAQWQIGGRAGTYNLELTAQTRDGTFTLHDKFEVAEAPAFDVKRAGPTRIFPLYEYPMRLNITARSDFSGQITETIPASFIITNPNEEPPNNFEVRDTADKSIKQIVWQVELKAGQSTELAYAFDAPDESPQFFLLGPLEFRSQSVGFKEVRSWQIAVDATGYVFPNADFANSWRHGASSCSNTSGNRWDKIDEVTDGNEANANGDTDHVCTHTSQDGAGTQDSSMSTLSSVLSVSSIQIKIFARCETCANGGTADDVQVNINIAGADQSATTVTPTSTYAWHSAPFNGTWTQGNLDGFRVKLTHVVNGGGSPSGRDDELRVSTVYGIVTYTSSAINVTGFAYEDEGTTPWNGCNGVSNRLSLRVNGANAGSTSCSASNGSFSFLSITPPNGNDPMILYFDGVSGTNGVGTSANRYSGSGNVTNFIVRRDRLLTRSDSGSLTNANLGTWDNANDTDIVYDVNTSNQLVVEDGIKLIVHANTFTPGSLLTTDPSSSAASIDGDIQINSGATLSMASNLLKIGGDFNNQGTYSKSFGQIADFTATATGHTITTGSSDFHDVRYFGSGGGGWSFSDASDSLDGSITMVGDGTLSGSSNLTINGGGIICNTTCGSINMSSGTVTLNGTGNFGHATHTSNWTFDSLTFAGTTTALGTGTITINEVLNVSSTLNAGAKTYVLTDADGCPCTPFTAGGTFNADTSTVRYTSTQNTNVANVSYYNLETQPSGGAGPTYTLPAGTGGGGGPTSSGPNSPSTVVDDSSIGTATWNNPSNATTEDGSIADSVVDGSGLGGGVTDTTVKLVKGGVIGGNNNASNTSLPTTLTYQTYGSSSDLWGLSWAVSDINASDFGVAISYTDASISHYLKATNFGFSIPVGATIDGIIAEVKHKQEFIQIADSDMAQVDHIRITVHYTASTESTLTINNNLTVGDGTNAVTTTAATNDPNIDVGGNVTINANGTLVASDDAAKTFTVAGNWSNSGTFTHNSGTVTLDGAASSTLNGGGTGSTKAFYNLTLGKTATATITLTGNQLDVDNNLTINSGNTLDASATNCSGASCNTTVGAVLSNAGIITARASTITLEGSGTPFTNTGTFTAGTSTVKYTGTTATNIINVAYYNLVSEPAGGNTHTLPASASPTSNGPNNPATLANDASIGSVAWADPSNASASDGAYASASLPDGAVSNYLKVTDFGFSIPSNAIVSGIVAEVERVGSFVDGGVVDNAVRLVKGGTIQSTDKSSASIWPIDDAYASYGSSSDLWGTSWTTSDINASNFGFAISAKEGPTGSTSETASIDHIRITVHYSLPLAIDNNFTVGGFGLTGNVTAATNDPHLDVGGDVFISQGTTLVASDDAAKTFTVAGHWTNDGGDFTHNNQVVTFDGSANKLLSSGGTTSGKTFYNLSISKTSGASITLSSYNLKIENDLTINSGAVLDASTANCLGFTNSCNLTVGRNWTDNGTFTARTGTVVFDTPLTSIIEGPTTFYNLTSITAGKTLEFTSTQTFTIASGGLLTLTGASGNELHIHPTTATSQWFINHQGTESVSFVHVHYGGCDVSSTEITATDSTDGGNNDSCWNFGAANTAPNSPADLAQKKTDDTVLATGDWTNESSIKFTASATDTDNPDTLSLCIEIDPLGTGFSNTEDSCGTGVAYSGSAVTVTHTISSLAEDEYHWQARIKDDAGEYSAWVSYGGNAESARDVGVDTSAPTGVGGSAVYDGTTNGVDADFNDGSLDTLSANWDTPLFNGAISGLNRYEYSIGTTQGAADIKTWTSVGTAGSVTVGSLTLRTTQIYYFSVRAVDNAGNTSIGFFHSDGQLVEPSLSFTISPTTVTFANLNSANSYTDTQTTTLTTSTNAYGGYVVKTRATDLLQSAGADTINMFNGGTYAAPDSWQSGDTGFGYTSSDALVQGSNIFQIDPCPGGSALAAPGCYAPFSTTAPGDILADHTANVTGTPISNEQFTITYRVTVDAIQPAGTYSTVIIYNITAYY